MIVGIWLPGLPSFSSQVTMSRLSWVSAQAAYPLRWARSQASPVATGQSCMSWHRFGMTKDTVGSRGYFPAGKLVHGWLSAAGTLRKLVQGTCLRAYSPLAQHGGAGRGQVLGVAGEGPARGDQLGGQVGRR